MFQINHHVYNSRKVIQLKTVQVLSKRSVYVPRNRMSNESRRAALRRQKEEKSRNGYRDMIQTEISTQDSDLQFKLQQLREFSRSLRIAVKNKPIAEENTTQNVNVIDDSNTDKDSDLIFNSISQKNVMKDEEKSLKLTGDEYNLPKNENLSTIILASTQNQAERLLPSLLRDRIEDDELIVTSLTDVSHSNWNAIISKLFQNKDKLDGLELIALRNKFLSNCQNLTIENIKKLDEMLMSYVFQNTERFDSSMYECLISNLASTAYTTKNTKVHESAFKFMKLLLKRNEEAVAKSGTSHLNQKIMGLCLKFSSKIESFEHMNYFLKKIKDYDIKLNKQHLTTVLQFYHKNGDLKHAWDVFATMKFLSKENAPDIATYNSVLLLAHKTHDYAKALDLYNELLDKGLTPSETTFSIMAKILATASRDKKTSEGKSESLRLLGWKFIHQIQELSTSGFSNTTMESMMSLASYDGDIALTRALYFKFITDRYRKASQQWQNNNDIKKLWLYVLDPKVLNYLFVAYARFDPSKLPILMGYDKGTKLRRDLINSVDYSGKSLFDDNMRSTLPMLLKSNVDKPWEILAESRALWQFNLEFGGQLDLRQPPKNQFTIDEVTKLINESKDINQFKMDVLLKVFEWKKNLVNHNVLNHHTLMSYITIPIKLGDPNEVILRFNEFSYQQHDFDRLCENAFNQKSLISSQEKISEVTNTEIAIDDKNVEINKLINYTSLMKHKILANSTTYQVLMKAASRFQSLEISQYLWEERGKFRKTAAFQNLNKAQRIKLDTEFAVLSVEFFVAKKMYEDALGIIMSSNMYINWTYPMVRDLHKGLIEIEDASNIAALLKLVNKKSKIELINEEIKKLEL